MWERKLYKSENYQEFSQIKNKVTETIKAPIKIGNGRYEITDILSNSGGFGVIYKAKDNVLLGRNVLIKARKYGRENLFTDELNSKREETIERIRHETLFEAKALCNFAKNKESRMPNVNNIVKDFSPELKGPHKTRDGYTFTYDNESIYNNEPYLVMQVIDGENLLDYAESNRDSFSTGAWDMKVLEIAKEITTILRSLHAHQKAANGRRCYYIYRDLKPDNIMITEGRYLTLLDFGGVGLVIERENGEFESNKPGLGVLDIYTPGYCSPEAAPGSGTGTMLDQRTDIYSLGMTMFQLLVGGSITSLVDEKTQRPLLEKLDGKCSPYTRELIEKCTAYNKENRFFNMQEVLDTIMSTTFTNAKKYWNSVVREQL